VGDVSGLNAPVTIERIRTSWLAAGDVAFEQLADVMCRRMPNVRAKRPAEPITADGPRQHGTFDVRALLIDVHEHGDARALDQRAHSVSLGFGGPSRAAPFAAARAWAHDSSQSDTLAGAMEKPKVLTAKELRTIMPRLSGWKLA
jgi:hypothetical protein